MSDGWIEVDGLRVGPNMVRHLRTERDELKRRVEVLDSALRNIRSRQPVDPVIGFFVDAALSSSSATREPLPKGGCLDCGATFDDVWKLGQHVESAHPSSTTEAARKDSPIDMCAECDEPRWQHKPSTHAHVFAPSSTTEAGPPVERECATCGQYHGIQPCYPEPSRAGQNEQPTPENARAGQAGPTRADAGERCLNCLALESECEAVNKCCDACEHLAPPTTEEKDET